MASYKNLTPYRIDKLSEKEMRTAYSEMRSVLRKRVERLQAKGLQTDIKIPPRLSELQSDRALKAAIAETSRGLRDPRSTIKGRFKLEEQMQESLKEHGYDFASENPEDFGRFMEATRARMGSAYKGQSGVVAAAYEELRKAGVTGKTLARSFKAYLESTDDLSDLVNTAEQLARSHEGRRVTGVELRAVMQSYFPKV